MENRLKKQLEIELNKYIKYEHTTEECDGFIDGFEKACEIFDILNSLDRHE